MDTLGERIKFARKKKGITQQNIRDICGISSGNLSEIENNKVSPTSATLISLKRILEVSVDWLLTGEGEILSKRDNPLEEQKSVWNLSDYQKVAVEESLDCLTEEQAALINNYEKLDHRDKAEIRLLIEHKLKTYEMGLSSNLRTSKDGKGGSQTA